VADSTDVYESAYLDNPSLPIKNIMDRLQKSKVLLALAPNSYSPFLYAQVVNISKYIIDISGPEYNQSILLFESQGSLDDYMTNKHYDDEGYKNGKVALAIILNDVDPVSVNWDYSIRANFSYPFESSDPSVSCLYGSFSDCPQTFSIPSTQFYTEDLIKPQVTTYMYGYTYSGFSTLQLLMDQYIFSTLGLDINIRASIGKF
jgi:hypothetical protein